jgi:hypothetical protein
MKKYLLMAAIFLVPFFLTSCEKEKTQSELLIGKWDVKSETDIIFISGVKTEEHTYYLDAETKGFQFTNDGTAIVYELGQTAGLVNWSIDGSSLIFSFSDNTNSEFEFTVDNNTLTLSFTGSGTNNEGVAYTYKVTYTAERTS